GRRGKEGRRVYRSGDVVRRMRGGEIEYEGREDEQVKIRGNRVEIGEIEVAIREFQGVKDAVVLASRNSSSGIRIEGFVTAQAGGQIIEEDLRAHLRERLPEYMVPAVILSLDAIPINASGKADRTRLSEIGKNAKARHNDYVQPSSRSEIELARIWSEVLGVERVGIHDNFFALGGDSILAIQVVAKARRARIQLNPRQIFQNQTISQLAKLTTGTSHAAADREIVTGEAALTPIQHRFFDMNLYNPHHFNQGVMLELRERIDPRLMKTAIDHLLLHHDALRSRFKRDGAKWTQIIDGAGAAVPFTIVNLSALDGPARRAEMDRCAAQLQESLNITEGPLLRVGYFDFGEHEHGRLLIVIHHLVVDGVSWRILFEDLQAAYTDLSLGRAVDLPAKTTSVKRWASSLMEYAKTESLDSEMGYWVAPPRLSACRIPLDFSGGKNTVASTRTVSISLTDDQTRELMRGAAHQAQINETLLAAVVSSIARWTGAGSLLIDLEGHGREEIFSDSDLSRTVGWFTTIFPVLFQPKPSLQSADMVRSVGEHLRMLPRNGVGYGLLRYLSPMTEMREKLASMPESEIVFNYLGRFDRVFSDTSIFKWADEPIGPSQNQTEIRRYYIDISAIIVNGCLKCSLAYSENIHRRQTIEGLAEEIMKALLKVDSSSARIDTYSPSDFPDLELDQDGLDKILNEIADTFD
ncbi:MAG: condensation domain-containing protein, partial [Blastocatellia bacterium]